MSTVATSKAKRRIAIQQRPANHSPFIYSLGPCVDNYAKFANMADVVLSYDYYPETLHLVLAKDVKNMPEIKTLLMDHKLECALIKPCLVPNVFVVLQAAYKASQAKIKGKPITMTIYTEILYNLSPSKNIRQSLVTFGAQETDSELLVAHFGTLESLQTILSQIQGTFIRPTENIGNPEQIVKFYNIKPLESTVTSIENSVVSRIAIRGVV